MPAVYLYVLRIGFDLLLNDATRKLKTPFPFLQIFTPSTQWMDFHVDVYRTEVGTDKKMLQPDKENISSKTEVPI